MNPPAMTANDQMVYTTSYPRSGKSWFLYCWETITAAKTKDDLSGLLHHSHYLIPHNGHEELNIVNDFSVKNILLLRNYKEAIFSQLKNLYARNINEVIPNLLVSLVTNGCDQSFSYNHARHHFMRKMAKTEGNRTKIENVFYELVRAPQSHKVSDFLIEGLPAFKVKFEFDFSPHSTKLPWHSTKTKEHLYRNEVELQLSSSPIFHYHFALQLQRYYELLEYHDKVSKTNENNTLLIRYEEFVQNPFLGLSRVIDFLKSNALVSSDQERLCRHNLEELMSNIDYHRDVSVGRYKSSGHLAQSYGEKSHTYHTAGCNKQFLVEIDKTLKDKNLELFNKFLLDYEEQI